MNRPTPLILIVLMSVALPSLASGKVYRCQRGEVTVFSQQPCGKDAKVVNIHAPSSNATKQTNEQTPAQYVAEQQKQRQIAVHQRRIDNYKAQMAKEFQSLQNIRYRTPEDKDAQLKKLSAKYDPLIFKEQEAIKRLHQSDKPAAKPEQAKNLSNKEGKDHD